MVEWQKDRGEKDALVHTKDHPTSLRWETLEQPEPGGEEASVQGSVRCVFLFTSGSKFGRS